MKKEKKEDKTFFKNFVREKRNTGKAKRNSFGVLIIPHSVQNYILNRDGRVLASPASLRFFRKEISDLPYLFFQT